jgi:Leucine-rich repeat (LRR) protein
MPLLETLTISLGSAVAKAILKIWTRDSSVGSEIGSEIIDLIKSKTPDLFAHRNGLRQFDQIAEKVAETLLPIFESEGAKLDASGKRAVSIAVAESFNHTVLTAEIMARRSLDPVAITQFVKDRNPDAVRDFSADERALYDRIISESSQCVVDIASQLPSFSEKTFAEVLRRSTEILDIATQVLTEVRRIREASERANADSDATVFEADYRKAVIRTLDEIELFGVDLSRASSRHSLSLAYITLSMQESAATEQGAEQLNITKSGESYAEPIIAAKAKKLTAGKKAEREESGEDEVPVSADDALAHSRLLLIRGDAGSGKTTLLQSVAVRAAAHSFTAPLEDWNDKIPFFVRLRQCVDKDLPEPQVFPALVAPAISATMPQRWVHEQLKSGRALVLIDGLDEVPSITRSSVRTWIKGLLDFNPDTRVLVTSRRTAVEADFMKEEGFGATELLPMQLGDIFAFIDHWHEAVRQGVETEGEKHELPELVQSLKTAIKGSHSLRNLASTPVLCAMLCGLHRDRRRQLPSDRIELYRICCEALIDRRDRERGLPLKEYPNLSYPQKVAILRDLASWLMLNNWSMATREKAEARVGGKIPNMHSLPPDASASRILGSLVDRSGVIREPVKGYVDFAHRTFQEFLAAQAILDEGNIGFLVSKAHDDQWREVFILAAGLASSPVRRELIQGALERGDKEAKRRQQLHLVAVACMEASLELDKSLVAAINERFGNLVPPRNLTDAKALASAGLLAVPHLAIGQSKMYATSAAACVRSLALIGGDNALDALATYADDERQTVTTQLVRAWENFDRNEFAEKVLAKRTRLTIDDCTNLEGFDRLQGLRWLQLWRLNVTSLDPLSALRELTYLFFYGTRRIDDLSPLGTLKKLEQLVIYNSFGGESIEPLAKLKKLERLLISGCNSVRTLEPIKELRKLSTLELYGCPQIADFSPIGELENLIKVTLTDCEAGDPMSFLSSLGRLQHLQITGNREITNLDELSGLTTLRKVSIENCAELSDIRALGNLQKIETLSLLKSGVDLDLSVLEPLSKLRVIQLVGTVAPRNVSSLEKMPALRWIGIDEEFRSLSPSFEKKGVHVTHRDISLPGN